MDTSKFDFIRGLLRERILVLDGAMGSVLQCASGLHSHEEGMLPDLLVRENPGLVEKVHREYLEAGADIIETDSFNSNRHTLADCGLELESYAISREAAALAKKVAQEYTAANPRKPRLVAGSVGPTKHMLTLAASDTEGLTPDFDSMADAYNEQIRGLLDGGADIILLETIFDTLTAKAAIYAVLRLEEERGEKIPVMISCTLTDSGRLLSGQTPEAFLASVSHAGLLSVGFNCGFGSGQVAPYLRRISEMSVIPVSVYPNAGLPDDCGSYNEDPATFASNLRECLEERLVNILGGCCGTTPAHIRAIAEMAQEYSPRPLPHHNRKLVLSNLEYSEFGGASSGGVLVQIGERTNVSGSAKFARLIREKNFEEALEIASRQVKAGARIIDVCMDDGMEDAAGNMLRFLQMINADSDTDSVPVMIDSSDWNVITKALKTVQGKCVVNSISLKDGEKEFLDRAREIRRLGAATVVMLFDEYGQAETYERKTEIAERAYRLLIADGFEPSDIIFDPNVLTVGLKESDAVALDFIRATRWIKENLPHASVSAGVSNLSFAFRGNNLLREAMHTVFLYHAVKAGLDMAIVNAGMLGLYDDIEPRLLILLEDVILCRTDSAVAELVAYAQTIGQENEKSKDVEASEKRQQTLEENIASALSKGRDKEIAGLIEIAMGSYRPMSIIEDILMPAMKNVGTAFGAGRMFLPQVIKSAHVMRHAVEILKPSLKEGEGIESLGRKVLAATVKGDVHDIGKNIVSLVVSCNGFQVVDLGVRVDETTIAAKAEELRPEAILLSGLISPSLNEMVKVCEELERRGLNTPVVIGGAATSEIHTAVRIAPVYSGPVFYSSDAAANLKIISDLSEAAVEANRKHQEELRRRFKESRESGGNTEHYAASGYKSGRLKATPTVPASLARLSLNALPLEEAEPYIDWDWLRYSLGVKEGEAGHDVIDDAKILFEKIKKERLLEIEGVAEIFKARGEGDDIVMTLKDGTERILSMPRATGGIDAGKCVADFLALEEDYLCLFAVTAGKGLGRLVGLLEAEGATYDAVLAKLIADRLAEASAVWLHHKLADDIWGFEKGVRIAFGYPSAPDHGMKRDVFEILGVEASTVMRLTETAMIIPGESVCGIILSSGEYINAVNDKI